MKKRCFMQPVVQADVPAKRGIALVVVLGMMAMLVILSVSFVITMRMERLAGRDYGQQIRAKNLVQMALAHAMENVESQLENSPTNMYFGTVNALSGNGQMTNDSSLNPLNNNWSMLYYMPLALSASVAQTFSTYGGGKSPWSNVVNSAGLTIGRYHYCVLDCSGLLDANVISNLVRNGGADPGEIGLPGEVLNAGGPCTYNFSVSQHRHRYESVAEIFYRSKNSVNNTFFYFLSNSLNSVSSIMPVNLFSFSYSPNDCFILPGSSMTPSNRVYIGNSSGPPTRQNIYNQIPNILAMLSSQNLLDTGGTGNGIEPAFVTNLCDYLDTSGIHNPPTLNNSICTKAIPMINEVVVTNLVTYIPPIPPAVVGAYSNSVRVAVELYFPFWQTNVNSYRCQLVGTYTAGASAHSVVPTTPAIASTVAVPAPPGGVWCGYGTLQNQYQVVNFPAAGYANSGVFSNTDLAALTSAKFTITAINLTDTAGPMPPPYADCTSNMIINIGTKFPGPPSAGKPAWWLVGAAANDPRINWNGADTTQWAPTYLNMNNTASFIGPPTMGSNNPAGLFPNGIGEGSKNETFMYAKGQDPAVMAPTNGQLRSIGELSYLLYNSKRPWKTVQIYRAQGADAVALSTLRLYDLLSVGTNFPPATVGSGGYNPMTGYVNPNTTNQEVLTCVFVNTPNARCVNDAQTNNAQQLSVRTVANSLAQRFATYRSSIGLCTNLSDVCCVTDSDFPANSTYWQNKAIMRNSIGLFNPRQNMWVVYLRGQSLDPNLNVTGDSVAVAYVWRDPYPNVNGNGTHRCFVQFFKWL